MQTSTFQLVHEQLTSLGGPPLSSLLPATVRAWRCLLLEQEGLLKIDLQRSCRVQRVVSTYWSCGGQFVGIAHVELVAKGDLAKVRVYCRQLDRHHRGSLRNRLHALKRLSARMSITRSSLCLPISSTLRGRQRILYFMPNRRNRGGRRSACWHECETRGRCRFHRLSVPGLE